MDNEHMLLELDHISKIYGDLHAVDDLSLTVPQGQWLAIVGSSGSGKTTLMNMIGCMDTPSKGSVMLEGRRLEDLNARQLADVRKNMIGLVFQKFYLVPHLTAVENVMVAQYYHSVVDEKQAMEALERVGLKERAHHLPGQLSGGEQQRVCIARALINCPKLILADEPTGNLDEKNEKIVLDLFRQLHEQGTTIIVVTHDALVAPAHNARSCSTMVCSSASSGTTRKLDGRTRRLAANRRTPARTRRARRTAVSRFRSPTLRRPQKPEIRTRTRRHGRGARMSATQSNAIKVIALSAASIALLSACGEPKATPMDDEYAGNSGESVQSQEEKSKTDGKASGDTADDGDATKNRADANSATSDKQDTGNYADGDYSINGQYGPVGEDTIDVHLTVKDQNVTAVKIVGHPFTSISKKHQNDFAKAVPDAVIGKPLKDLKVDKLAGASWTSEAFNKALEVARQEASIQ